MSDDSKTHVDKESCVTLHQAAINNDIQLVQKLLDQGADVNEKDKRWFSPLSYATSYNKNQSHFEVIELLLNHKADVSELNGYFVTPLWNVVWNGTAEMVRLLLKFKADVNFVVDIGQNLLFAAVNNRENVEVLQLLLDLGLDVYYLSIGELTPLHQAAIYNKDESHLEIMETLLKNGADVQAKDHMGRTPLHQLVENCSVKVVDLFLKFKMDVNVLDRDERNLLFSAVKNEKVEVVQHLVDLGVSVNHHDLYGRTPLHSSSVTSMKNVKCLLKNGGDTSAVDSQGLTPYSSFTSYIQEIDSKEELRNLEKKFKLLMEHTAFDVIHEDVRNVRSLFFFDYESDLELWWKWILEHVVKLEVLKLPVLPAFLNIISELKKYYEYYKQCKRELLLAKNIKIPSTWVTFFKLATDSKRKLKNYAGNFFLMDGFKKTNCRNRFPIYGATMEKNVEKGVKIRNLFDRSCVLLSNCLPIFRPDHLIVIDTLDCLISNKNLSKFCE